MPETIDDTTPLTAARIDVPARIGWLTRTHRTVAGLSLRQMSAALADLGVRLSAATLSRTESEGTPTAAVLEGYTAVLGLPTGQLRTAVDLQRASFSYAPAGPVESRPRCLESFSRSYDAVARPSPTAGDWLEFAHQHTSEVGYGLPTSLMGPLVERLLGEAARGIRESRMVRHEAVVTLLHSPYQRLVLDALKREVETPYHQNFTLLANAAGNCAIPEVLFWGGRMLAGPTSVHVHAASCMLQSLLVQGGVAIERWHELVPYVEEGWRRAQADPVRVETLSALCAALPPVVQARLDQTCWRAPVTPRSQVQWSRSRDNVHYAFVTRLAAEVTARLERPEEPLLARLLFESFFEPRGVRMANAFWLVALSAFADTTGRVLLDRLDACPDELTRAAALRVAVLCHDGSPVEGLEGLLELSDPSEFCQVLTLAGRSGALLAEPVLRRGLAGDTSMVRQTLYALGMAGDPRLVDLAEDVTLPDEVRGGARWWLAAGSRLPV
jgi:hypothetical protein